VCECVRVIVVGWATTADPIGSSASDLSIHRYFAGCELYLLLIMINPDDILSLYYFPEEFPVKVPYRLYDILNFCGTVPA